MKSLRLFITDIDGVWTDGGMYYDGAETELKKFNTSDSVGVAFLHALGIPVAIITGEDTSIVQRRSDKLKIDYLFMGAKNKLNIANDLCRRLNITLDEVGYIGDSVNDIPLLRAVGFSAAPADAPGYIRKIVSTVVPARGGEGAFRAFVEHYLEQNNLLDEAINRYLESLK